MIGLGLVGAAGTRSPFGAELFEAGVNSAADLAVLMKRQPGLGRPVVGHVFGSSMHHYLIREWLASGGLDPDKDTKLCVIPPPQMLPNTMRGGYLDLFSVWASPGIR